MTTAEIPNSEGGIPNRIFEQCTAALPSLARKVFAITGTTSGTGYYTCEAAIQKGAACLILLNRESARSVASAERLAECKSKYGSATILHRVDCDLQSFSSVSKAAATTASIAATHGGLDGLVNNAGVMGVPDYRTPDGYDVQMQVAC